MASDTTRAVDSAKIWATVITNLDYLPGLLTLHHSIQATGSKYPLLALYTETFPATGRAALAARNIPSQLVSAIRSTGTGFHCHDAVYEEAWSKLVAFSLVEYQRVVLLDSDMLFRLNMDELMDLDLGSYLMAASHACVCNPRKKRHYPAEWIPSNCAFTAQHADPLSAQIKGYDPNALSYNSGMNTGLVVINPSTELYTQLLAYMASHAKDCILAEQDLISKTCQGKWMPLPYVYNALKTLRDRGVHDAIWRDDRVKNVHYIQSPKPWNEIDENGVWTGTEETHTWWVDADKERKASERAKGINDGF